MMFGSSDDHARDAEILVGRGRPAHRQRAVDRRGAPRLGVADLQTAADPGECPLREVSLELWPGEVLGIAGVDGNGQKHLAEVARRPASRRSGVGSPSAAPISRAEGVPARRAPGPPLCDRRAAGRGHGRPLLRGDQSGAEGDRRRALLAARAQRLGSDPRPCPRADPPPRHPHALGEDAVRRGFPAAISRRCCWRASSIPTPASSIFNKPTYGLDLQNTRLAHDRILASAEQGLADHRRSPPTSTSCWSSATASASCSRAASPASSRTARMWSARSAC